MVTRSATRALAALMAAALLAGCGGPSGTDGGEGEVAILAPGDLAEAVRTDLASGVPVQGTLEPAVDVMVVAPYPEVLEAVEVKEGQAVRRGQVLARFRMSSVAPAAASAEAQRRIAAAEYTRMQNLLAAGAVAQRDVDNAEAQLKAAEAQAALAEKHLGDATVTAAFDGVIARRFVQTGDRVGDGDPLFRLVNTAELEFSASVPTEALGQVRPGAPVALAVSGLEGVEIAGRVARVNATVDPATRQVQVYVSVPNRGGRLAGDMFASGRIVLDQRIGVTAVPAAALRRGAGAGPSVWVVAGDSLERRTVTVGLRDEMRDLVEIPEGVRPGETLVVSPMEDLTSGQRVEIAGAAAAGPADSTAPADPSAPAPARAEGRR